MTTEQKEMDPGKFLPGTSSEVLLALSEFQQAISGDMTIYARFVMVNYNSAHRIGALAAYYVQHQKVPMTIDELNEAYDIFYNRVQVNMRRALQKALDHSAEIDRHYDTLSARGRGWGIVNEDLKRVREELKNSNKPHVMGTVKEIAAKYNISLSEVRRLKAEGRLEDLEREKVSLKVSSPQSLEEVYNGVALCRVYYDSIDTMRDDLIQKGILASGSTKSAFLDKEALYLTGKLFNVVLSYDMT